MKRLFLILAFLLLPTWAQAAIRYADPAGSGSTCSEASPCTLATGLSQTAGGDTLRLHDGLYTSVSAALLNPLPSGSASAPTIIEAVNTRQATLRITSGSSRIFNFSSARSWITIRGFVLDGTGGSGTSSTAINFGEGAAYTDFEITDNEIDNTSDRAMYINSSSARMNLRRNHIHDVALASGSNTCIYFQAGHSVIEHNELSGCGSAINFRNATPGAGVRNIVRYNYMHGLNNLIADSGARAISINNLGITTSANGHLFHHNIMAGSTRNAFRVDHGPFTKIYNNLIYNITGYGIQVDSGETGVEVKNNIIRSISGASFSDSGTGTAKSNNFCDDAVTGCSVTDPLMVAPGSGDFRLTSSSPAINAGVNVNLPFNGAAPEIGPWEVVDTSAITAVATDSSVDLTFPINIAAALPLLPSSGITGFTLSDTRTVTSATLFAEGIIRLTYTGTCTGGTVSYAPGNVTDSILIGNSINQPLFAFSGKAVTNSCGGGTPTPPPGLHIDYALDDGSGTNANDGTANNLDGTLTTGPTWVSGHTGSAVYFAANVADYIAVPYGNAVNPSTQSLTICAAALPDSNATAGIFNVLAVPAGTNQRLQIAAFNGAWSLAIQGTNLQPNTEFPVTAAWTRLCVVMDSGTDTATLYVNGVAGTTAQSIITYTSYALAGNFDIGRLSGGTTKSVGFAADDFKLWTSVKSPADDYAAWSPPAPPTTGTFTQVAYQFYLARKDSAGNLLKLPLPGAALNASAVTPAGGVVAVEIQVNCDNVANCDPLGMVLQRAPIGVDTWSDVPDSDIGAASFYGTSDSGSEIPSGVPACPLSGALVCVDGGTVRTASAVPTIDLGQNQSTVNRYLVKVNQSSRFRLRNQSGNIFGTYTQYPTVTVVGAFAGVGM